MLATSLRILVVVFLLSACSFSRDGGYGRQFTLEPAPVTAGTYRKTSHSLRVKLPSVAPELDTDRIAIIQPDGRQDYIANAKWADFLPVVIQSALVRSFAASGRYGGGVTADDTSARAQYVLATEVEDFHIEMPKGSTPALAHIRLRVKLQRYGSSYVLRQAVLENTRPVVSGGLHAMMRTLNTLLGELQARAIAQMGAR